MNNNKQTAVEWLYDELLTLKFLFDNDTIEIGEYIERQLIAKQKAKQMEKGQMIEFANWLDKLTPSQRVSVWCKDGSASGLFTMDNEQLFEQFKKVTFKSE